MKIIIDNNSINIFTNKPISLDKNGNKYVDLEVLTKDQLVDHLKKLVNTLKWLIH